MAPGSLETLRQDLREVRSWPLFQGVDAYQPRGDGALDEVTPASAASTMEAGTQLEAANDRVQDALMRFAGVQRGHWRLWEEDVYTSVAQAPGFQNASHACRQPRQWHQVANSPGMFLDDVMLSAVGIDNLATQLSSVARCLDGAADLDSVDPAACARIGWLHVPTALSQVAEDIRAFGREKWGYVPDIEVKTVFEECGRHAGGEAAEAASTELDLHAGQARLGTAVAAAGHIEYVAAELLKNSVKAMVDRYGALDVDMEAPIQVTVASSQESVGFSVSDTGGGCSDPIGALAWFASGRGGQVSTTGAARTRVSAAQSSEVPSGYHYSRDFGAPFSGFGMGLPRARLYCALMGGTISLASLPAHGVAATVVLPRLGHVPDVRSLCLRGVPGAEHVFQDR